MSKELELLHKLLHQKAYNEVIAEATRFLDQGVAEPHFIEFALIKALVGKKQVPEAISKLVTLTETHSLREEFFHYLGDLLMLMGWGDQAKRAYARAIELNPDDYRFFNSLAECCRKEGDSDGAFAAYERALQLVEREPDTQASGIAEQQAVHPLILEDVLVFSRFKGRGTAENYSLFAFTEDKLNAVFIPLGPQASFITKDALKDPASPFFAMRQADSFDLAAEKLQRSLSSDELACFSLYPRDSFSCQFLKRDAL